MTKAKTTPTQITMEAESEVRQPSAIKLKIVAEVQVTEAYLKDVEGNSNKIRFAIDELENVLDAQVLSVNIE